MVRKKIETKDQGPHINRRRYDIEFGSRDHFMNSYRGTIQKT